MIVKPGSTDVTTYFHLRLAADGTDATGLTITNIDLQYVRSGEAPVAKVDATALAATNSAHSDNTAIEIDATDQPGVYRVDWPDAAFASGVREVILTVKCATVFTESLRVQLQQVPADVTHWLGTAVATPTTGGVPEVDLTHIAGSAVSASTAQLGVNVVNFGGSAGTFASGIPAVNTTQIEGSDATNQIRDAVVDDATRIDASALNTASGAIGSDGTGLTEAGGTGDHLTAINLPNQTMDIVGNITGNLSGSVGSVTGAVGSVTGDVGGNVTGTVGGFTAGAKAEIQTEAEDALVAHRLDELLNADSDIDGAAPPTVGSVVHELLSKTAGSFTYDQTTDSLEAVRDRGDAAWATATGFSTHSAADVWSSGTRTLTAGTNIVLAKGTGVTGFNDLSAAQVNSEVDSAIETYHLDHLLAADYDPANKPGTATALLNELVGSDAGVSQFTANALELAPSGSGATADEIADEVETRSLIVGTNNDKTGYALSSAGIDAILDDAPSAELSSVPTTTGTLRQMIQFLFTYFRNKRTITATTETLYKEDASTSLATATVSDDGTTVTKGEMNS